MSRLDLEWPEGATHYDSRDFVMPTFMRKGLDGGGWEYLGAHGWKACGPISELDVSRMARRPEAWAGDGLPPVGTACECMLVGGSDEWVPCEIVAHKDNQAVCWVDCNRITASTGTRIRPIRTPEQVAAEDRAKVINRMRDIILNTVKYASGIDAVNYAEVLYDAGLRFKATK